MRLFTGIALPPDAGARVEDLIRELRPLAKLAWTKPEKLHITTKFIGDWPESRLDELKQSLSAVKSPAAPIEIHLRRLGWLPNPRFPNSLFVGLEPSEPLMQLNAALESALECIGIPREKRWYRPHLTLGRVRGDRPPAELREAVRQSDFEVAPFLAASFHLYLSANGTYTKLSEYSLNIS